MVKVFKIKKYFRNGKETHNLVLKGHQHESEDSVEHYVDRWCQQEPSGHNNGWSAEWDEVTDPKEIKRAIQSKIDLLNERVTSLENEKMDWEEELESYNPS